PGSMTPPRRGEAGTDRDSLGGEWRHPGPDSFWKRGGIPAARAPFLGAIRRELGIPDREPA
nr:hypothetical protein [Planctomycetota bacterium]